LLGTSTLRTSPACVSPFSMLPFYPTNFYRQMCSTTARNEKNKLREEKSPYLQQHQNNPVNWLPYSPEAFHIAAQKNLPTLISIGYSTCHWCHVMEKESFEDEEVANILNKYFVAIKVDREELPDVDALYMRAATAIIGRGGWPLTIFADSSGKPFWAGTYYPKKHFIQYLRNIGEAWTTEKGQTDIDIVRNSLLDFLTKSESPYKKQDDVEMIDESIFDISYSLSKSAYDPEDGGFGLAPKFPPATRLQLLLRIYRRTKEKEALEMVEKTLEKMSYGGIYDHLGGGFARYSTDKKWLIPHFEKMLYDNALLLLPLLETYQLTKKDLYASVAKDTIKYVLDVMENKEQGGFYSAEDADSEGVEGKFYVWTWTELESLLTEQEFLKIKNLYGVTANGNFEHNATNFSIQEEFSWEDKNDPLVKSATDKLRAHRAKRIHPLKDDKQLTSWNGLMIRSLAYAAQVFGNSEYLLSAQKGASFIVNHLYDSSNKTLLRRYRDGESKYQGTLEDYSYFISALLQLYQTDFNESWFKLALDLQQSQDELFWDDEEKSGYFFTAANSDVSVLMRSKEFMDNAQPNSNCLSVLNLLQIYALTCDEKFKKKAEDILQTLRPVAYKFPDGFNQLLCAVDFYMDSKQLVVLHPNLNQSEITDSKEIAEIREVYAPNLMVAAKGTKDTDTNTERGIIPLFSGKTIVNAQPTYYLCESNTCQLPKNHFQQIKFSI